MRHGSLFSGVGGWSVASDEMNWITSFMCEWDENKQYVLKTLWPKSIIYGDITKTDFNKWRGIIDILTASTPCQPYSLAGKRQGSNDVRHLWPETHRAIREIQPQWFVLENVSGLVNWSKGMVFKQIIADLENEGYEVLPFLLPACGVNAPHKRERIWIVAYSNGNGHELRGLGKDRQTEGKSISEQEQREWIWSDNRGIGKQGAFTDPNNERLQRCENRGELNCIRKGQKQQFIRSFCTKWDLFPTVSPLRSGDDGFSRDALRLFINENSNGLLTEKEVNQIIQKSINKWNNETIAAGGDAIVPAVSLQIFKAIEQFTKQYHD